jgi:glycosyltransferase involved in cell wall biosynthesis
MSKTTHSTRQTIDAGTLEGVTVGIVVQDNFPVDRQVRAKRIARTLDDKGSEVVVFARNTGSDPARGDIDEETRPKTERLPYALVRRFSVLSSTPLFNVVTAAIPLNPAWILWSVLVFSRHDVDVVVVCDLRTGISAGIAAKLLGLPVVLDLRENYVGLAKSLPAETLVDRLVQNERLIAALERSTIRLADLVWVVVEERRTQLVEEGVPASKLVVVSNTPELSPDDGLEETMTVPSNEFDWPGFTLVYVGVLNEFRGLDLIVEAIAHLQHDDSDQPVHFAIAGDGPHRAQLERRCRSLGIEDQVTFTGWIDAERVPEFLASGDLGVIPHRITPLTEQTVPNKLFDCMVAGLPVLTRDVTPIRRIVEAENCGWILPSDVTPEETAVQIRRLTTEDLESVGMNGRKAVENRYNWSRDAKRVTESLARLHKQQA